MEAKITASNTLANFSIDSKNVNEIKRRFLSINRERLRRVQETFMRKQRSFLDLLPLLFHTNHQSMPGFTSDDTPYGIADYRPTKATIIAAKKINKDFSHKVRALREYQIHSIFLMGSSGTIAYSKKSDLDIWVCVQPGMQAKHRLLLQEKALLIQQWAEEIDLEIHFFVMDAEHFRLHGHKEHLSHNSSGDTQHYLLVEEFYRTGLLVSGKYPIWWLVPPEHEQHYHAYIKALIENNAVSSFEYIDFGGLSEADVGEFFGSALWQLYKAVHSPYKSFLKILLMESYTNEYPEVAFPCQQLKSLIHSGNNDIDMLDPYVLLLNKVEKHLEDIGETERLDLARRCFYFKINDPNNQNSISRHNSHQSELLKKLIKKWGWSKEYLNKIKTRNQWKTRFVTEEREQIIEQITHSYRKLTSFARTHTEHTTDDTEYLNILGRKLYATFEKRVGKVELINPNCAIDMSELKLTFYQQNNKNNDGWILYDSDINLDKKKYAPLKRSQSLIEMLAWCHFNRVLDRSTGITLQNNQNSMTYRELRGLITTLVQIFPHRIIGESTTESLAKAEGVQQAHFFINIGIDPLENYSQQGLELVSTRNDALSYSGLLKNLVRSFDILYITTWQQILTHRYTGESALLDCLCDYLSWYPMNGKRKPDNHHSHCLSGTKGPAIANRIQQLFDNVIKAYYHAKSQENTRYIIRMESAYYVIQAENGAPNYTSFSSYALLLEHLGAAQPEYSPIMYDQIAFSNTPLPYIFDNDEENVIQLYYELSDNIASIYISDERGSIFHQKHEFHSEQTIANQFLIFFESCLARKNQLPSVENIEARETLIEINRLQKNKFKQYEIKTIATHSNQIRNHFVSLQVLGEVTTEQRTVFTIYYNNREFSTLEYGDNLYKKVAASILQSRTKQENYPIYITDIDLSRSFIGYTNLMQLQTIHFLNYKKWIEAKLNTALTDLR